MSENRYKITVNDGVDFYVELEIINKSSTLKSLFKDNHMNQYKNSIIIPNIDSQTFTHILAFMRNYSDLTNSEYADKMIDNMNCNTLMDIIHAANLLDIKPLVEIGGNRFKNIINNNDINDIRKIFKIKNDFTAEEQLQIDHNFKWT